MDELQFHPIKLRFHPNKLRVRQKKLVFRLVGFRLLGAVHLFNVFESSADPVKRGGLLGGLERHSSLFPIDLMVNDDGGFALPVGEGHFQMDIPGYRGFKIGQGLV